MDCVVLEDTDNALIAFWIVLYCFDVADLETTRAPEGADVRDAAWAKTNKNRKKEMIGSIMR